MSIPIHDIFRLDIPRENKSKIDESINNYYSDVSKQQQQHPNLKFDFPNSTCSTQLSIDQFQSQSSDGEYRMKVCDPFDDDSFAVDKKSTSIQNVNYENKQIGRLDNRNLFGDKQLNHFGISDNQSTGVYKSSNQAYDTGENLLLYKTNKDLGTEHFEHAARVYHKFDRTHFPSQIKGEGNIWQKSDSDNFFEKSAVTWARRNILPMPSMEKLRNEKQQLVVVQNKTSEGSTTYQKLDVKDRTDPFNNSGFSIMSSNNTLRDVTTTASADDDVDDFNPMSNVFPKRRSTNSLVLNNDRAIREKDKIEELEDELTPLNRNRKQYESAFVFGMESGDARELMNTESLKTRSISREMDVSEQKTCSLSVSASRANNELRSSGKAETRDDQDGETDSVSSYPTEVFYDADGLSSREKNSRKWTRIFRSKGFVASSNSVSSDSYEAKNSEKSWKRRKKFMLLGFGITGAVVLPILIWVIIVWGIFPVIVQKAVDSAEMKVTSVKISDMTSQSFKLEISSILTKKKLAAVVTPQDPAGFEVYHVVNSKQLTNPELRRLEASDSPEEVAKEVESENRKRRLGDFSIPTSRQLGSTASNQTRRFLGYLDLPVAVLDAGRLVNATWKADFHLKSNESDFNKFLYELVDNGKAEWLLEGPSTVNVMDMNFKDIRFSKKVEILGISFLRISEPLSSLPSEESSSPSSSGGLGLSQESVMYWSELSNICQKKQCPDLKVSEFIFTQPTNDRNDISFSAIHDPGSNPTPVETGETLSDFPISNSLPLYFSPHFGSKQFEKPSVSESIYFHTEALLNYSQGATSMDSLGPVAFMLFAEGCHVGDVRSADLGIVQGLNRLKLNGRLLTPDFYESLDSASENRIDDEDNFVRFSAAQISEMLATAVKMRSPNWTSTASLMSDLMSSSAAAASAQVSLDEVWDDALITQLTLKIIALFADSNTGQVIVPIKDLERGFEDLRTAINDDYKLHKMVKHPGLRAVSSAIGDFWAQQLVQSMTSNGTSGPVVIYSDSAAAQVVQNYAALRKTVESNAASIDVEALMTANQKYANIGLEKLLNLTLAYPDINTLTEMPEFAARELGNLNLRRVVLPPDLNETMVESRNRSELRIDDPNFDVHDSGGDVYGLSNQDMAIAKVVHEANLMIGGVRFWQQLFSRQFPVRSGCNSQQEREALFSSLFLKTLSGDPMELLIMGCELAPSIHSDWCFRGAAEENVSKANASLQTGRSSGSHVLFGGIVDRLVWPLKMDPGFKSTSQSNSTETNLGSINMKHMILSMKILQMGLDQGVAELVDHQFPIDDLDLAQWEAANKLPIVDLPPSRALNDEETNSTTSDSSLPLNSSLDEIPKNKPRALVADSKYEDDRSYNREIPMKQYYDQEFPDPYAFGTPCEIGSPCDFDSDFDIPENVSYVSPDDRQLFCELAFGTLTTVDKLFALINQTKAPQSMKQKISEVHERIRSHEAESKKSMLPLILSTAFLGAQLDYHKDFLPKRGQNGIINAYLQWAEYFSQQCTGEEPLLHPRGTGGLPPKISYLMMRLMPYQPYENVHQAIEDVIAAGIAAGANVQNSAQPNDTLANDEPDSSPEPNQADLNSSISPSVSPDWTESVDDSERDEILSAANSRRLQAIGSEMRTDIPTDEVETYAYASPALDLLSGLVPRAEALISRSQSRASRLTKWWAAETYLKSESQLSTPPQSNGKAAHTLYGTRNATQQAADILGGLTLHAILNLRLWHPFTALAVPVGSISAEAFANPCPATDLNGAPRNYSPQEDCNAINLGRMIAQLTPVGLEDVQRIWGSSSDSKNESTRLPLATAQHAQIYGVPGEKMSQGIMQGRVVSYLFALKGMMMPASAQNVQKLVTALLTKDALELNMVNGEFNAIAEIDGGGRLRLKDTEFSQTIRVAGLNRLNQIQVTSVKPFSYPGTLFGIELGVAFESNSPLVINSGPVNLHWHINGHDLGPAKASNLAILPGRNSWTIRGKVPSLVEVMRRSGGILATIMNVANLQMCLTANKPEETNGTIWTGLIETAFSKDINFCVEVPNIFGGLLGGLRRLSDWTSPKELFSWVNWRSNNINSNDKKSLLSL